MSVREPHGSLDEVGGKVRSVDDVYAWDQTRSKGLLIDVEHQTLGSLVLPGPPLRFFIADGTEVTRTEHTAPPTLDGDGETVRSWVAERR